MLRVSIRVLQAFTSQVGSTKVSWRVLKAFIVS